MTENALRWPMMIGTYLEVEGCLGEALVSLLGGDMDFNILDSFVMTLETGFNFVLLNVNGLGGGGGSAERTYWFKKVFASDVDANNCFSCI